MKAKLLLGCLIVFGMLLNSASAGWWDHNWKYKVQITKNGTNPLGLFSMTSIPGFSMSQVKADAGDIRYLDPTETVEWPFSNITVNSTDVVLELFNNGTSPTWLYWGNPSASSANPPSPISVGTVGQNWEWNSTGASGNEKFSMRYAKNDWSNANWLKRLSVNQTRDGEKDIYDSTNAAWTIAYETSSCSSVQGNKAELVKTVDLPTRKMFNWTLGICQVNITLLAGLPGYQHYFTTTSAPSADTRVEILNTHRTNSIWNRKWQNGATLDDVPLTTASGPITLNTSRPWIAYHNQTNYAFMASLLTVPGTITQSATESGFEDANLHFKVPGANAAATSIDIFGTNVSTQNHINDIYDVWKNTATFTSSEMQHYWWNDSWKYRAKISKTGKDFFGRFSMISIPGFDMSQIQPDAEDVRHIDSTGSIEWPFSNITVNSTDVVLELFNGGTSPTWLYWGNPDAPKHDDWPASNASFQGSAIETKWWNDTWTHRARITKNGNHPLGQFSIASIPGFNMSQIQPDADDIRYLDPTGSIEWPFSNITVNSTDVVLELFNNGTSPTWLYWGNPSATFANPPSPISIGTVGQDWEWNVSGAFGNEKFSMRYAKNDWSNANWLKRLSVNQTRDGERNIHDSTNTAWGIAYETSSCSSVQGKTADLVQTVDMPTRKGFNWTLGICQANITLLAGLPGYQHYFTTTGAPSADTRKELFDTRRQDSKWSRAWQNGATLDDVPLTSASGPITLNTTRPWIAYQNQTDYSFMASLLVEPGTITQSQKEAGFEDAHLDFKVPGANVAATSINYFGTNVSTQNYINDVYDVWKTPATFTGAYTS